MRPKPLNFDGPVQDHDALQDWLDRRGEDLRDQQLENKAMKEHTLTKRTYECPKCGSDIRFPADFITYDWKHCRCHVCHTDFRVDYDSGVEHGALVDRTKLLPME